MHHYTNPGALMPSEWAMDVGLREGLVRSDGHSDQQNRRIQGHVRGAESPRTCSVIDTATDDLQGPAQAVKAHSDVIVTQYQEIFDFCFPIDARASIKQKSAPHTCYGALDVFASLVHKADPSAGGAAPAH